MRRHREACAIAALYGFAVQARIQGLNYWGFCRCPDGNCFVLRVGDEIVAVMDGAERVDLAAEERRRAALIAFIGAGMPSPPATAVLVAALAGARRAVAMHQARGLAIDRWLAGEIRLRGIRGNAAVLAVLEMPARREEVARAYSQQHPDRAGALHDLLAVLDWPRSRRALPPGRGLWRL
jgi:hypothetical protein